MILRQRKKTEHKGTNLILAAYLVLGVKKKEIRARLKPAVNYYFKLGVSKKMDSETYVRARAEFDLGELPKALLD